MKVKRKTKQEEGEQRIYNEEIRTPTLLSGKQRRWRVQVNREMMSFGHREEVKVAQPSRWISTYTLLVMHVNDWLGRSCAVWIKSCSGGKFLDKFFISLLLPLGEVHSSTCRA